MCRGEEHDEEGEEEGEVDTRQQEVGPRSLQTITTTGIGHFCLSDFCIYASKIITFQVRLMNTNK